MFQMQKEVFLRSRANFPITEFLAGYLSAKSIYSQEKMCSYTFSHKLYRLIPDIILKITIVL